MLILLTVAAAHADCSAPDAPEVFGATLVEAQASLEANDVPALRGVMERAEIALPCLDEPLAREDAATYHRMLSVVALMDDRPEEAMVLLQASLEVFQDGAAWLQEPAEGWWIIDGARTRVAPNRPYVLQRADAEGRVVETRYVDGPPPTAAVSAAPPAPTAPVFSAPSWSPPDRERRVAPERKLLGLASGLALTSGALYWAAASKSHQFYDLNTDEPELAALRQQTNSLVAASAVLGFGALGTAGAALVVEW